MDKKDLQKYINRWNLMADIEAREIRNAPFKLLLQQTFSIWDISRSLKFDSRDELPRPLWVQLQRRWKERHA